MWQQPDEHSFGLALRRYSNPAQFSPHCGENFLVVENFDHAP
jgi:hypothetical protein